MSCFTDSQRDRVDAVARRPISFTVQKSEGLGSIPWAGTHNQTVHPSGIGKLVAISRHLDDHRRILRSIKRPDRKTAGVKTMLPEAR